MRGKNAFKIVFENNDEVNAGKGRSSKQLARRNECLADRYFYYGHFTDKRYDAIIALLSNEFFLSTATIPAIIQQHMEQLQMLKKKKPGIYYFQCKWPHMKW